MSRQRHNWMQTAIVIGTLLPVILSLGGWILYRSNNGAVIAEQVQDQNQEIKDLQNQMFRLQLDQARQSCKP